jgi:hypothetical protein
MSFVSEDVANVNCSAGCSVQAAYDRELAELHRLPGVTAVGREGIQNFFGGWGVGGDSWKICCYEAEQGGGMFCDLCGRKIGFGGGKG